MTPTAFRESLARDSAPPALSAPLAALWWAGKGDWEKAHKFAQDDEGADAAWVHAYLHRVEGDLPNARYWYHCAGQTTATGTPEAEWAGIAAALLARTTGA